MAKKNDTTAQQSNAGADIGDEGEIELSPGEVAAAVPVRAGESLFDPGASALVNALALRDCVFGTAGDVITLDPETAETGRAQGALDLTPSAVRAAGG